LGAIASTLAIFVYALSDSIAILLIGAIIGGFSEALFSGNNNSLLYDSLKDENKEDLFQEWLGKVSSFSMLGLGISSLLGSILANWSFRYMMWASVVPVFMSIIVALMIKEPRRETSESSNIFAHLKQALKIFKDNRKLRLVSIIKIWYFSLDESSYKFNSAFVQMVWPIWAIGMRNVVSKVIGSLSFATSDTFIRKLGGAERVLYFRTIWDHVSRFLALLIPNVWSPIIMTTNTFWWATGQTAEDSLLQKEFTSKQRSTMASFVNLGQSILFAVFAYLVGLLGDWYGPIQALLVLQIAKLSIFPLLWKLFKLLEGTNADASTTVRV
jgi:MFS family permease